MSAGAAAGYVVEQFRRGLVPRTAAGRRLSLIALLDSFGTGMFLAGASLYFTRVVGLSAAEVGFGLSLAGLVGLVGVVPMGMLADRLGAGRLYVVLQLWRGLGYLAYAGIASFHAFLVVPAGIGLADVAVPPVHQAVVGAAVPAEDRVDTLAKVRAVRNVGFGLGSVAATVALARGSREAFAALVLVNAASFLAAAALLSLAGVTRLPAEQPASRRLELAPDIRYLAAALLNGLLAIHMTMLGIGLPLWIAGHTRVPVVMIGFLIAINTAMTAGLQARFARAAERMAGALRCMRRAGAALAAFGLLAYLMGRVGAGAGVGLALAAIVVMTCAELWQSAGGWTISWELAPRERRSQYLATFQLVTSLQSVVGLWVVAVLVFPSGAGWAGFAATTLLAGMLVGPAVGRRGRMVAHPVNTLEEST